MSKNQPYFLRNKCKNIQIINGWFFTFALTIFFISVFGIGCTGSLQKDKKNGRTKDTEINYIDSIVNLRSIKEIEFLDSTTSRFNKQEIESFHGFNYFEPNINYYVIAQFVVDTTVPVFGMKTNTSRTPTYRTYGYLDFVINDTNFSLTAFQNMDYKDHPEYGGSLFVPFTDKTNGGDTYKAGRYIDIPIPEANTVMLDFNNAYNPYCAYSDRWSCPLVPYENHLNINISAGEKKYK